MALDKGIEHGKEKRKKYYGSKAFDHTCRNHGSCPWCAEGRQHRNRKSQLIAEDIIDAWEDDEELDSIMDFWKEEDNNGK